MGGSSKSSYMAPPPMAPGKTWNVTVGGSAGLVYTPSTIEAAVGDIVVFTFLAKNHTLTQSTFPLPCVKMGGGMDSGFMPNPEGTLYPAPSFSFQVNVTTPLWFYCRQTGHCGMGMVFSINPTVAKSQSDFLAEAIAQNGTKSTMSMTTAPPPAMTTMYTAAPPAMSPPPPMSAPPAAPPPAAAPPAAAPPAAAPPAAAPPVSSPPASGSNTVGGDTSGSGDSCSCSCFCGVADFPPMAGMYNYGGMGGAMPAMPASAPPAAPAAPPPSAGAPLGGAGG
ncbi:hypothetical protein MMC06_001775 [Schaereria dolodes]|nr:hypothetical protein [Schaereria dolodes]